MSNYCKSCGISIPDGQNFCSMCYGDPAYGSDGYYMDYLEGQREEEEARRREEEHLRSRNTWRNDERETLLDMQV